MLAPDELFDYNKLEKGRGYDKKDVDDLLQLVYDNYKDLYFKNVELSDQVKTLNSGLQHYKSIEASLQKALILAEKTADETIQTAKLRADSIIREAESKAQSYTADSHSELEAVHGKTIALMQEYVKYKAQFNKLIQEQLDLLNGSKFEISTDDLKAFKTMEKTAVEAENKVKNVQIDDPAADVDISEEKGEAVTDTKKASADTVVFSSVQEHDTAYEAPAPDKVPETDVAPVASGLEIKDPAAGVSEKKDTSVTEQKMLNNLDYLNAAEKINEEAFRAAENKKV